MWRLSMQIMNMALTGKVTKKLEYDKKLSMLDASVDSKFKISISDLLSIVMSLNT